MAVRGALVAGVAAQAAVMIVWHIPAAYDAAEAHVPLHAFEHGTYLAAGWLFWWAVSALARPSYGLAVLALFVSTLPCTAVGAGLALSPNAWYSTYPSLNQQQAAGVLMWVVPSAVFVVAGAAAFMAWLTAAES
jgi:cytochrome c oxidase assembly factor CtaG